MTPRWTAGDVPDLAGRRVLITGGARGLGLSAATVCAHAGADVVVAVRDVERAAVAVASIGAVSGSVAVETLDVSSLTAIRGFVERWDRPVDVLINNAGVMAPPFTRTPDGFELQAATNVLGPFALTTGLLPHLTDRVVHVSSQAHRAGRLHLDDLAGRRRYRPTQAYCDSKLAVAVFSTALQQRFDADGDGRRSIVAHPGVARTALFGDVPGLAGLLFAWAAPGLTPPDLGVLPILFAATQDVPGNAYVGPGGALGLRGFPAAGRASSAARDAAAASAFWDEATRLTAR